MREVAATIKCAACGWLTHAPEPHEDGTPRLPVGWIRTYDHNPSKGLPVCRGKGCRNRP